MLCFFRNCWCLKLRFNNWCERLGRYKSLRETPARSAVRSCQMTSRYWVRRLGEFACEHPTGKAVDCVDSECFCVLLLLLLSLLPAYLFPRVHTALPTYPGHGPWRTPHCAAVQPCGSCSLRAGLHSSVRRAMRSVGLQVAAKAFTVVSSLLATWSLLLLLILTILLYEFFSAKTILIIYRRLAVWT